MKILLFRYLAARFRHRGSPTRGYIRAGMGLERRAQDLSIFWQDHLSRSRAAQARWAGTYSGDVLTVLGAGPLFDFNAPALSRRFKVFRLVDANPLLVSDWSRLNKPIQPVITDVSNCMESWSEAVRHFPRRWDETLRRLQALSPIAAYSPPTDGLLSLNILSQLEIVWQEAVESILQKRFGGAFVREREQEWLNAIGPSSQLLAEQHLSAIETSRARHVLLISDIEYVDYTGRRYTRQQWSPPPLQWSESGWHADPGIRYEVAPALEAVILGRETFARWMPSYRLEWQESWLWHISPDGTETSGNGKLHRVAAFSLRHCDSVSD